MVTIIAANKRTTKEGKVFMALTLQGDVEMVQSQKTGKFFLTSKRCSIPSTFDEVIAQSLIGKQIPGMIERVECDSYEYTVQSTGEKITLAHTYEYHPGIVPNKLVASNQSLPLGN